MTLGCVVTQQPEVRERWTVFPASCFQVGEGSQWLSVSGNLLIYGEPGLGVRYGDTVELVGRLEAVPEFDDVSYRNYLSQRGISAVTFRPRVAILGRGGGSPVLAALYDIKGRLLSGLRISLPPLHAALAAGITLGEKGELPDEMKGLMARTSLTHILVASGANLVFVGGALAALGRRFLGRHGTTILVLLGMAAYAVMTGAETPVVRAAIMVGLATVAPLVGRESDARDALMVAILALLLWNPRSLWDVSFQLSVAATTGLVFVAPVLTPLIGRIPRLPQPVVETTATALAAQTMATPLIAYQFHQASLIGPLANILALPLVPYIMIFGALTAGLGAVAYPVSLLTGWIAWGLISLMLAIVRVLGNLPWAYAPVPEFSPLLVGGFYALVGLVVFALSASGQGALRGLVDAARQGVLVARRNLPPG
jgi:competence protein ComEC